MRVDQRLSVAVELGALRLLAPRRFAREPLDALLSRPRRRAAAPRPADLAELERDVLRVEALLARARFLRASCLYRALARYSLLRRRGFETCFVLGIDAAGLERPGHAWVEVEGRPFAEGEDVSRYRVTFRYPPRENDGSVWP